MPLSRSPRATWLMLQLLLYSCCSLNQSWAACPPGQYPEFGVCTDCPSEDAVARWESSKYRSNFIRQHPDCFSTSTQLPGTTAAVDKTLSRIAATTKRAELTPAPMKPSTPTPPADRGTSTPAIRTLGLSQQGSSMALVVAPAVCGVAVVAAALLALACWLFRPNNEKARCLRPKLTWMALLTRLHASADASTRGQQEHLMPPALTAAGSQDGAGAEPIMTSLPEMGRFDAVGREV